MSEKMPFEDDLRKIIIEIRKEKSFTQRALAEAVGVSESTISRYEAGKTSFAFPMAVDCLDALGYQLFFTVEKRRDA